MVPVNFSVSSQANATWVILATMNTRRRLRNTVAHRGHCFHKEKTLQIKKFLANININTCTSKQSSNAHCKQKRNCKKYMHTTSKRITRCKQNSGTPQTKELHAANKTPAHCKQNSSTLQTKLQHAANKTPACCKRNSHTLQTKLQHAANKTPVRCKRNSRTLQAKLQHAANKTPARCKQNSCTLQAKELHAANKTPAHCKQNFSTLQTKAKVLRTQDDVKDWDLERLPFEWNFR